MSNRRLPRVPAPLPVRLLGRAARAAERLPGAGLARARYEQTESWLMAELKHRLDGFEPDESPDVAPDEHGSHHAPPVTAAERFTQLLEASLRQRPEDARAFLYQRIAEALVPDEARIVAALSEGDAAPLCHVGAGMAVGPPTRRVLSNASTVGKDAGVMLPECTALYVSHLRELGLLDVGPEDADMDVRYEILASEESVREAVRHVEETLRMKPRLLRRTLRLSALGRDFWQTCRPGGGAE